MPSGIPENYCYILHDKTTSTKLIDTTGHAQLDHQNNDEDPITNNHQHDNVEQIENNHLKAPSPTMTTISDLNLALLVPSCLLPLELVHPDRLPLIRVRLGPRSLSLRERHHIHLHLPNLPWVHCADGFAPSGRFARFALRG
ncbi:hypothetical protein BT69DRAFT_572803 [Atractiella rhizophila]|nr:hypothetical protein BT69DRAFT_572803 [Atractiella rhizophila]